MKIGNIDFDAIIFDLDGTLYNKKAFTLNIILRTINSNIKKSIRNLRLLNALLHARNKIKGIDFKTKDAFYRILFKNMETFTNKKTDELQEWYFNSFYPVFIKLIKDRYNKRKEVPEILNILKNNNVHISVLSDYLFVEERLKALSINTEYFTVITSNEEYGALKPCAKPLLDIAFNKIKVKPEKVLVVGDRTDTDGEGARLANMPFIKIKNKTSWKHFYFALKKYKE